MRFKFYALLLSLCLMGCEAESPSGDKPKANGNSNPDKVTPSTENKNTNSTEGDSSEEVVGEIEKGADLSNDDVTSLADELISAGTLNIENELADAFPTEFAISSPTVIDAEEVEVSGAGTLDIPFSLIKGADGGKLKEIEYSLRQKIISNAVKLSGKNAESCKPLLHFKKLPDPTCYGQEVTSDPSEITSSSDLITFPMGIDPINIEEDSDENLQRILKGDAGIIAEKEGENACLAAAVDNYVGQTTEKRLRKYGIIKICKSNRLV